ncbi:aminotransferase class I/II-fold pyridoxal phosphate-dependent enzyme [Tabrizicola sp.]|uniref:aminotransferase class I/II-fold pyridoxal phosphate-dependent enzyme n=1 Tax=Tabrizicola sp. TaxID=2005166 RepID=UPI0025EA05B9|nr:aminotransferase class I/II-fold pyridoxal phosphate-dependent enzyme [Tabrizicola sp.]
MPGLAPARSSAGLTDADDAAVGLARLLTRGLPGRDPSTGKAGCRPGQNFAAQDYLGLLRHPAVQAAACPAPGRLPDPDARAAASRRALETRLAAVLNLPHAATFASGAEAIRQTCTAILSPDDVVLLDSAAPAAMSEAVLARRAGLHRFPSGPVGAVERRLARLARQRRRGRLVLAVPAVSEHGSRIADLAELAMLARLHQALLIVDVSQDLGAIGPDGGGVMEVQGCLGRVDIVLGSLANCFGAEGGFAAFRDPGFGPGIRRDARPLSAGNAGTILAAAEVAFGVEGRRLRRNLQGVSLRLRNHLMADGARVIGGAAPLVPVLLPAKTALPRTALLESAGPRVTLLQAPVVSFHAPRWRIGLNAGHGPADIDDLADLIRDVNRAFDRSPGRRRAAV